MLASSNSENTEEYNHESSKERKEGRINPLDFFVGRIGFLTTGEYSYSYHTEYGTGIIERISHDTISSTHTSSIE